VTYDLTVSVAKTLAKLDPTMTFIYVSGAGTDSTERGRLMWARIKGRTENALLQMPFKAVFLFRPAYIQPLHGIRTKTSWYGAFYAVVRPFYPLLKTLFPNYVTTTECVGRAMLHVTKRGFPNLSLRIATSTSCARRTRNETSHCPHASKIRAEPADQARARGGIASTRICVARNKRKEDGEATTHASRGWTHRKPVLAYSRAWHEGGIRPQH
jgi:hypothetical protein